MTDSAPALKVTDLRKVYAKDGKKEGTIALKGVSLAIDRGEFFGLLGPNGAGKSTLIGIVSGLVTKSEGTAEIAGVSLDSHPDKAKSYIGLVPQEFNFNIFEKVIDIVVDQAGYYGMQRKEALERAEVVLKDLGLWEKKDAKAQALSGGMKRRLMIARALVHSPEILLLDEPTAGVDVELRRGMWDFLRKLNESGTTIVLTTHYLEEAELLCTRLAIINGGEIIEEGSVKSLLAKLSFVTLLLDTQDAVTPAQLALMRDMEVESIDENTLKLTLKPGETVNDSIRLMTKIGIQIANIRNSGSRLEEVFVNLIDKDKK
ncbi:MAG: ABC transporter ATP-binding protein [Patescibacteria group bacterium]